MRKIGRIFFFGLLALFFVVAGSALAHKPVALTGTTWTGSDITVVTAGNPGTATTTNAFTITFTEVSSTQPDLLGGTFSIAGAAAVDFSAVQNGDSVSIVAAGYIIHARVETRDHKTSNATMQISGKNLTNGSQFFGTLTE
jgi:hypothetical protein